MPAWQNSSGRYGTISLSLHWLMAFLVVLMLGLGWGRDFAPGPWRPVMMQVHTGTGMLMAFLFFARLAWRLYSPPPRLSETLSRAVRASARGVHGALYAMLFLMPLSGWVMVSAMGRQPSFFGWFDGPSLLEKNRALVPFLKEAHGVMAYGFLVLIAMHAGAALLHHLVYRDDTLVRMLPFLKRK